MRKKIILTLAGLLALGKVLAQDSLQTKTLQEVVVTGTRYGVLAERSGKTITKFTNKELQLFSGRSIGEVLTITPNVYVDGVYGAPGTNIGYYVRGSKNRQSVILLDGIPMVDPSGISPEFDLRLIALDQIDNIEVMRGGLSTLYGSGAAASVINITTKRNIQSGVHGTVDVNAGSFNTFSQNLSLSGSRNKFYFQLLANNTTSDGFSSADDSRSTEFFDKDGLSRQNGLLKLGLMLNSKVDLQVFGGYDKFNSDYDGGPYIDAANTQTYKQLRGGLKSNIKHGKGELTVTAQHTELDKNFKSMFPSQYTGYSTVAEVYEKYDISSVISLLGGLSYQNLSYEQPEAAAKDTTAFTILDPYVSAVVNLPNGLNIHAGARLNTHSEYGSNYVYNLNPSYLIKLNEQIKLKVLASASTSYITPSLYQLYSIYGNKNLKPEKAFNAEGGLVLYAKDFSLSVVYFDRNETNAYGFEAIFDEQGNFTGGRYYNLDTERNVNGVEVEAGYALSEKVSVSANYSYVTSDNEVSFYRIPKNKFNISAQASLWKDGNIMLLYNLTGERTDFDYAEFKAVTIDAFGILDFYVSQGALKNKLVVYGTMSNVLDAEYVWAPGYTSMGRNITIGARFKF